MLFFVLMAPNLSQLRLIFDIFLQLMYVSMNCASTAEHRSSHAITLVDACMQNTQMYVNL